MEQKSYQTGSQLLDPHELLGWDGLRRLSVEKAEISSADLGRLLSKRGTEST